MTTGSRSSGCQLDDDPEAVEVPELVVFPATSTVSRPQMCGSTTSGYRRGRRGSDVGRAEPSRARDRSGRRHRRRAPVPRHGAGSGNDLEEALCRRPLDPMQAVAVGTELADALAYVHSHGIVHRDVKPGNVLLSEDGRILLTDFGIAKLTSQTADLTGALTMGTAAYLAPEQLRRDPPAPPSTCTPSGSAARGADRGVGLPRTTHRSDACTTHQLARYSGSSPAAVAGVAPGHDCGGASRPPDHGRGEVHPRTIGRGR
jgi:Protein kinase domain